MAIQTRVRCSFIPFTSSGRTTLVLSLHPHMVLSNVSWMAQSSIFLENKWSIVTSISRWWRFCMLLLCCVPRHRWTLTLNTQNWTPFCDSSGESASLKTDFSDGLHEHVGGREWIINPSFNLSLKNKSYLPPPCFWQSTSQQTFIRNSDKHAQTPRRAFRLITEPAVRK